MFITKKLLLKNGLQLWLSELPNTHSVSIDLFIKSGVRYENINEIGITHLLEHLHFREMCNMSQRQLYFDMESMGTTLRAVTYRDFLRFYLKVTPEKFKQSLEIFAGVFQTYDWSDSAFEKEKNVVIKQILEHSEYNSDAFAMNAVFGEMPVAKPIMGIEKTINSLTVEDVVRYKKDVFRRDNMLLCVAGNIIESDIATICNVFGDIPLNDNQDCKNNCIMPVNFENRCNNYLIEDNDWDTLDVDICFDVNYDKISLKEIEILNCILGEGVGSRLQWKLRESKCITTDIFSTVDKFDDLSVLHIKYSVTADQFYESLSDIVTVLNGMKSDITERDFLITLPFYDKNLDFCLDDTSELSFLNGWYGFILDSEFKKYSISNTKTAAEKFKQLSERLFLTKNLSLVVMGNCSKIKKSKISAVLSLLDSF